MNMPQDEAGTDTGNIRILSQLWSMGLRALFLEFLTTFNIPGSDPHPLNFYERHVIAMLQGGKYHIEVGLDHIHTWSNEGGNNTKELHDFVVEFALQLYADGLLRILLAEFAMSSVAKAVEKLSDFDERVIADSRAFIEAAMPQLGIFIKDENPANAVAIRDIRCQQAGKLVTLKATVTRTSDIRPELRVATFTCGVCETNQPPMVQRFHTEQCQSCSLPDCNNRRSWRLNEERSQFGDWQKLRLQENANEIPPGCLPRSVNVICRGHLVDQARAGDRLLVTGFITITPDIGSIAATGEVPKLIRRELTRAQQAEMEGGNRIAVSTMGARELNTRIFFVAAGITVVNAHDGLQSTLQDAEVSLNSEGDSPRSGNQDAADRGFGSKLYRKIQASAPDLAERIRRISQSSNTLDILASQFLTRLAGMDHVKKGLLCLLVGGVEKRGDKDGIKLRGDLNICIVGDPGTGKSLLLRQLKEFTPRSVLASGKMSTAAGLTASVVKDPESGGPPSIEAGALMLADKGLCCIDEFDKMDSKDMSAIHEAMEQQTISIAKAGVQATLNARASVVAVCSPAMGRYDPSRPLKHNLRLSAPIMSRFDLIFVIFDDPERDEFIAEHMLQTHCGTVENMAGDQQQLTTEQLWDYVLLARTMKPKLTKEAMQRITSQYVLMRQKDAIPGSQRQSRMTVRQLESLIRLSEAVAKLHFNDEVTMQHVEVAEDLFLRSTTKVRRSNIEFEADAPEEENEEPTQRVEINRDEYDQIAAYVIDHFKELEIRRRSADDFSGVKIPYQELVDWLLETRVALHVEGDEQLDAAVFFAERIVRQMIDVDRSLVSGDMLREGTEAPIEVVSVHPALVDASSAYSGEGLRGTQRDEVLIETNTEGEDGVGLMDDGVGLMDDELDAAFGEFAAWDN